jgi:hypothetical protein
MRDRTSLLAKAAQCRKLSEKIPNPLDPAVKASRELAGELEARAGSLNPVVPKPRSCG